MICLTSQTAQAALPPMFLARGGIWVEVEDTNPNTRLACAISSALASTNEFGLAEGSDRKIVFSVYYDNDIAGLRDIQTVEISSGIWRRVLPVTSNDRNHRDKPRLSLRLEISRSTTTQLLDAMKHGTSMRVTAAGAPVIQLPLQGIAPVVRAFRICAGL